MMNNPDFTIRPARWPEDLGALRAVREQVFVIEQNVPLTLEWDEMDARSAHVLALSNSGKPIGTGRLLPDGHIGRMAVLKAWRGHGIGSALLEALMILGWKNGHEALVLNAQVAAAPFYAKYGFEKHGEIFDEAGIPHIEMSLSRPATGT